MQPKTARPFPCTSEHHLVKPVKILVDALLNHAENTPCFVVYYCNRTGINAFSICKKKCLPKKNRSQFETKVSVLGSVQANCVKFKRQKSEFFEKSINLGGQKKLSQAMRDSQQTSSNAVRKNEEPRAEKIGVIQA